MTREIRRRRYLRAILPAVFLPIAGCPAQGAKTLGFWNFDYLGTEDGEHKIDFTVRYNHKDVPKSEQGFNDVVLVGYGRDGEEVCRNDVGDVPPETGNDFQVSVSCSSFPQVFTYTADESPCDRYVRFKVAIYRGESDGEHRWVADRTRDCDESLPPEIPSPTRTE